LLTNADPRPIGGGREGRLATASAVLDTFATDFTGSASGSAAADRTDQTAVGIRDEQADTGQAPRRQGRQERQPAGAVTVTAPRPDTSEHRLLTLARSVSGDGSPG
jgi:hypothetical protein